MYSVLYSHRVPVEDVRAPAPPLGVAPRPHVAQGRAHILLGAGVVHVEVWVTRPQLSGPVPAEQVAEAEKGVFYLNTLGFPPRHSQLPNALFVLFLNRWICCLRRSDHLSPPEIIIIIISSSYHK